MFVYTMAHDADTDSVYSIPNDDGIVVVPIAVAQRDRLDAGN